jgi:hypothetical protein
MATALPVGKVLDDFLNFAVADNPAKAHTVHAVEWNHDLQTAVFDSEEIEAFHRGAGCTAADLFNNSYAMVGVNYAVTDIETKDGAATHARHPVRKVNEAEFPSSTRIPYVVKKSQITEDITELYSREG